MSELRRWADDGAAPDEARLLDASRAERAPHEARTRALRALGLAAAATTTAATTAATAAGTTGLGVWTKLVGIALIAGGAGAAGIAYESRHARGPAAVAASVAVATPSPAEPTALEPSATAAPEGALDPADRSRESPRAAPAVRPARAAASDERLSREVAALELANAALGAKQPDAALRALDDYAQKFPRGALQSDATVLRVRALVARGDRAAAQRLADAYSAAHPDSPFTRRLDALVREREKP